MKDAEVKIGMVLKRVRFAFEARDGPAIQVTEIQKGRYSWGDMSVVIGTVIDSGSTRFPVGKPFLANARDFEPVED